MTDLPTRKRRLVQLEVAGIALHMFQQQGYENTTVDQIAAAAGMSRRTFFRYFASKEDVIVGKWAVLADGFLDALRARAGTDKDPRIALRRALNGVVEHYADPQRRRDSYAMDAVIDDTPALRTAFLAALDATAREAAAILQESGVQRLAAETYATWAAGALAVAMRVARDAGHDGIGADLDAAFALLGS